MLSNKMFDLDNEGQGHGVQYSPWRHSTANINLCKSHIGTFFASYQRFRDIHISKFMTTLKL